MRTGDPLPIGHLLDGRYRIHKLLGVGGMGRVYLANDTRLANRPVAVKEMLIGDGAQERKAIDDFHREASVLARLSHPSIPQIIDYFGELGRHYLVMEYIAGGDLQHQLDEIGAGARIPETRVVEMARQLLEVLQFLHSQKPPIVYRDLKPGNIMIDHQGRAMLIDFGIARFLPPGGRGTQIGSVGYAPPEQYLGKMEPRSDLYALAATMHHLLTGRDPQLQPPFSFPPVKELAPEVSAATAQVITAALDKDVTRRPASAQAMRDLLPKLAGVKGVSGAGLERVDQKSATLATAALDRPLGPSRSPTPRSIAKDLVSSALVKPSLLRPQVADSTKPSNSVPQHPAAAIAKQQRPEAKPIHASAPASSLSKTADLGLKKRHEPESHPLNPSVESGRRLSRVAGALASVRAVMAAGAATSTVSSIRTVAEPPLNRSESIFYNPRPSVISGGSVFGSVNRNDDRDRTASNPQYGAARLISAAEGVEFGVNGNRLILGRAQESGDRIQIDLSRLRRGAERISRRHAEIIKQGNDYFVRDLGSANGTYIVGRGRLGRDQLYKLKDRDELVLGGAKLEFRRN